MSTIDDYSSSAFRGLITQDASGKLEADETIIKSVSAATALYAKLRENHLYRILFYAESEGLLQGNPPYDPKEMEAAGFGYVANFNDMSARAVYERYCQAYWNLLYNAQYICDFTLRIKDPNAPDWAMSMARNWDIAVKKHWPSFTINVSSYIAQLVKWGVSPIIFPDERSPFWRVVEMNRFFVPDQAQSDLDMITTICVENEFTVQYLWQVYKEFKDKPMGEGTPWNAKEIGNLLLWIANSPNKTPIQPADMLDLQTKLNNGDISFDRMYNDCVRVVSLFQREYGGKISHYMFHRFHHNYNMNADSNSPGEQFLFYQHGQYKSMNEAVIIGTMTPGEYTIHANKGLCHKIYSLGQAAIMMDNSLVDGGRFAATPIIKSSALGSRDIAEIRFTPGVPTDIGQAEFVQNNLGQNMQHIITVAQYIKQLMQFNLTYSGSDPASPDPDKGSLSPSQVRVSAFREFNVLKNSVAHFYNTFDRVPQNMTAKMWHSKEGQQGYEMSQEWKELCLQDGVPSEIFELKSKRDDELPNEVQVQTTRVAGSGSQVALLMGLEALQPIMGSFTQDEQDEYKKLYITATVGPEYIDTFAQPKKPDEASGGSSLAGVENAIMQQFRSPVFSLDNAHREHWATHYALGNQTMQQINAGAQESAPGEGGAQQGQGQGQSEAQPQQANPNVAPMDVVEGDKIFTVLIPHMEQHWGALEQNPFAQSFVQQYKSYHDELTKYAALIHQNAKKAVEARAAEQERLQTEQQAVMNDEQRKDLVLQNDERRKDAKLAAQTARQESAGQSKEAATVQKTSSDIRIDWAKLMSDHSLEFRRIVGEEILKQRDAGSENGNKGAEKTEQ